MNRTTLTRRLGEEGLLMAVSGIALGIAGAFAVARVVRGLLFGVGPTDPATLGVVSMVTLVTAVSACCLAARKVTRVDPMVALKADLF